MRLFTCHFNKVIELAWITVIDFVQDNFSLSFRQPIVALDHASQLGIYLATAVIEDRASLVNIKLTVLVA
ncbi:MAG TPA: hypothetical protein ACHBX0_02080 [Arsenophonus sp.]